VLKGLIDRRQLGAYYTPSLVAEALCSWAITKPQCLVLEPSFGGCEFLDWSIRRLEEIGCVAPEKQIFGCDIDPQAFEHLDRRTRLCRERHFIQGDFLQVRPQDFGTQQFDAIIGNPPYVRHQNLDANQRRAAREIRKAILPSLSLQASLWGVFLIHSSRFLAEGGRVAWLLPSSFLYSDYSKVLRRFMRRSFEELRVIRLDERLFEEQGATEGTVVVAAAGWSRERHRRLSTIVEIGASSMYNLRSALFERGPPESSKRTAYERLKRRATSLGEYCSFKIGVVTGDTDFFLFNAPRAADLKLSEKNLTYIVSRASNVPGLLITRKELQQAYRQGGRVKIFDPPSKLSPDALRHIGRLPKSSIEANITFNKRPVWYRPLDRGRTDAFFTGMSHLGPRLVLNHTGATCTNSLYRVMFRRKLSERLKKTMALSLLSSFSQLSAERVGRAYSAGLLKNEPSDARSILVLMPMTSIGLKKSFAEADAHLRAGQAHAAQKIADHFLISNGALRARDCAQLSSLLSVAREERLLERKSNNTKNSLI
jgi:adenine-specific DNA-methyltransferase